MNPLIAHCHADSGQCNPRHFHAVVHIDDLRLARVARDEVEVVVAVDVRERDRRRGRGDQPGRLAERHGQHILERIRLRAVVAVELVGGSVVSDHEVEVVVAVHVAERQRGRRTGVARDRQGRPEPLPRRRSAHDLDAGVEIELIRLARVPDDDVDGAIPVEVADGQRCRRLGGGERARGRQGEGAGGFVEVEAIHRVQIADDQLEVTVAVDVGERDGGGRAGVTWHEGRPGAEA